MICDPEDSGLDEKFQNYKEWLQQKEAQGLYDSKAKRMVVNANHVLPAGKNQSLLLSEAEERNFRRQNTQIGKIVFLKDSDLQINTFEKEISLWVSEFYQRMHSLCARKPRFSEMRPNKFSI